MTTFTILDGRTLVFSDGSRAAPPDYMDVTETGAAVQLRFLDRNRLHVGCDIRFGTPKHEATGLLQWFEQYHATHGSEVPT